MNAETPFVSKRAPIAVSALMSQLIDDKIDLQKRLDAALSEIDELRAEVRRSNTVVKSWLRANATGGWIDDMREYNKRLYGELDALKKQDPAVWIESFPFGPGNKGIYGWSEYPIGTKFYLAAGAQPTRLSKDQLDSLEMVLNHYKGDNRIESLRVLLQAEALPTPMTQDQAEALAHRRCSRYIFIDTKAPYQFGAKDLMVFVRDIEKGVKP